MPGRRCGSKSLSQESSGLSQAPCLPVGMHTGPGSPRGLRKDRSGAASAPAGPAGNRIDGHGMGGGRTVRFASRQARLFQAGRASARLSPDPGKLAATVPGRTAGSRSINSTIPATTCLARRRAVRGVTIRLGDSPGFHAICVRLRPSVWTPSHADDPLASFPRKRSLRLRASFALGTLCICSVSLRTKKAPARSETLLRPK